MSSEIEAAASLTLNVYNSFKCRNNPDSYTVLASLFNLTSGKLIALATGTQACLRRYPDDIQDCHAESLLKRAYKRYLIEDILRVPETEDSTGRSKLAGRVPQNLLLFISKFPCGLIARFEGSDPIDESTGNPIRRKPGRGIEKDGKIFFVEKDPCLDKLKRWLRDGFQGRRIWQLTGVKSRIKKILIGDCESNATMVYEDYVEQMFTYLECSRDSLQIEVVRGIRQNDLVYESRRSPISTCLVCWLTIGDESDCEYVSSENFHPNQRVKMKVQLVVDGRKQGVTQSQCSSSTERFKLSVGDHLLRKDLSEVKKRFAG